MSQVAIIIDLPHQSADVVRGQTLLRVAEDTARAIRKSHPVGDDIEVRTVYVSDEDIVVGSEASDEPEVAVEPTPPSAKDFEPGQWW